ncbi:MAG: hypothetical protein K0R57_1229 [Paenibacillaceae bacterium]|jgi:hypothetical protein|nr:hypothetical protein [Paenibacillaceae bacterium]
MFGYITTNPAQLTDEDKTRYQAAYCGLCKVLDERHGKRGRATLTYDMTFLGMLLSSLYTPEETCGMERCLLHPLRQHPYVTTSITGYAADMNVVLAYYQALDDWQDDRSLTAGAKLKLLAHSREEVQARWPRQCSVIEQSLKRLGQMEQADELNPDLPANCFGGLLGELFVLREDEWAPALYRMGAALGRFVYMMDACMDLPSDLRRGRYNPLVAQSNTDFTPMLTMLIGECTGEFAALPLQRDTAILRNILYSGVWVKYRPRKEEVNNHHDRSL